MKRDSLRNLEYRDLMERIGEDDSLIAGWVGKFVLAVSVALLLACVIAKITGWI